MTQYIIIHLDGSESTVMAEEMRLREGVYHFEVFREGPVVVAAFTVANVVGIVDSKHKAIPA